MRRWYADFQSASSDAGSMPRRPTEGAHVLDIVGIAIAPVEAQPSCRSRSDSARTRSGWGSEPLL